MAWLNKTMMQRKAEAASAVAHPLLKETELSLDVKMAYLQGCVLATLLDDAEISDEERTKVRSIGLSLRLSDELINEAFAVVLALESDEQKQHFVEEILNVLKPAPVARLFMDDIETILTASGRMDEDAESIFEYFGRMLFASADWRNMRTQSIRRERQRDYAGLKKRLVEKIEEDCEEDENDDDVYMFGEYDIDAIRKEFEAIGITGCFVAEILKMLLPEAEAAFKQFQNVVKRADGVFASGRVKIDLFDKPQAIRYLRYVSFLDQCSTMDSRFRLMNFVGEGNVIERYLTWTKTSTPKADAKWTILDGYGSLLRELQFRCSLLRDNNEE